MEFIVPVAAFMFVMSGLAAIDRIKRDKSWIEAGVLAALSFAVMMFFVVAFASSR